MTFSAWQDHVQMPAGSGNSSYFYNVSYINKSVSTPDDQVSYPNTLQAQQFSNYYGYAEIRDYFDYYSYYTPPRTFYRHQGLQVTLKNGWQGYHNQAPAPMLKMRPGYDYARIPSTGIDPRSIDAYVDWEAGDNTFAWRDFPVTVAANSSTGGTVSPFRVRLVKSAPFDTTPNVNQPLSLWPDGDALGGDIIFSGDASTPLNTVVATITKDMLAGATGWFVYVESDDADGTNANLTVRLNASQFGPDLTLPRWRYWIPDATPAFLAPTRTNLVKHSLVVDCSGDAPVVESQTRVPSDLIFPDGNYVFGTDHVEALGASLVVSGAYYNRTVGCARSVLSVFNDDGTLRSETTVYERGVGGLTNNSTIYPKDVYANPQDPTECAVLFVDDGNDGAFYVKVTGVDTATPSVGSVIPLPQEPGNGQYAWPVTSTNPYRRGPGLIDAGIYYDDDPSTLPINAMPIHDLAMPVTLGSTPIDPYDPTGHFDLGSYKVFSVIGDVEDGSDPNSVLNNMIYVVDYRNASSPQFKKIDVTYADLMQNLEEPTGRTWDITSTNWLSAGSHSVSGSLEQGAIVHGFTLLSSTIDENLQPGKQTGLDRYTVIVSKVKIPVATAADKPSEIVPLPGPVVERLAPLALTSEAIYSNNVNSGPGDGSIVTPDGVKTFIVGTAPVLATADGDASYMEARQDIAVDGGYDKYVFGGPLAAYTAPDGAFIKTLRVRVQFSTTRPTGGYSPYLRAVIVPMLDTTTPGTLIFDANTGNQVSFYVYPEATPVWDASGATYSWATGEVDLGNFGARQYKALLDGRLGIALLPHGGYNQSITGEFRTRVSQMEVSAVLGTHDSAV